MAKTKTKTKKRTKARKGPRAMALTIAEPRLRGALQSGMNLAGQNRTGLPANILRPVQLSDMMLIWSPWVAMLRQQALFARGFLSMMEAQQKVARLWSLPTPLASSCASRSTMKVRALLTPERRASKCALSALRLHWDQAGTDHHTGQRRHLERGCDSYG